MKWERCSPFPKLIGDTSNSCYPAAPSTGTSPCLAFIDIYGVMLPGRGACDSSLSTAALGLFAAVHKAIMYLSPAAICHTLPRLSLCSLYNTAKPASWRIATSRPMARLPPHYANIPLLLGTFTGSFRWGKKAAAVDQKAVLKVEISKA